MNPELIPASTARKAGSPCDRAGSISRSVRRSEIEARSANAMAQKSAAKASGWPWKLPVEATSPAPPSPSTRTTGLSVTEASSRSTTVRAKAITSRLAPWTWGAHRSE